MTKLAGISALGVVERLWAPRAERAWLEASTLAPKASVAAAVQQRAVVAMAEIFIVLLCCVCIPEEEVTRLGGEKTLL